MSVHNGSESSIVVRRVVTDELLQEAFAVRVEVFVHEQAVPLEEEVDDYDAHSSTVHVVAIEHSEHGETILGTARLLPPVSQGSTFHIGRVAVRAAARGKNVGSLLVTALEDEARSLQPHGAVVELSAQEQALDFYRKLGYVEVDGRRYLDADIWHRDMRKLIS
ncbi:GNAT family N-acetyltransferase [Timonella sp. A28]|uniref:GNAT family N-acetyltransferase n=1 Tax=Timonella sp. A28 TaxID=3442640 RepID=UPI003EB73FAC